MLADLLLNADEWEENGWPEGMIFGSQNEEGQNEKVSRFPIVQIRKPRLTCRRASPSAYKIWKIVILVERTDDNGRT